LNTEDTEDTEVFLSFQPRRQWGRRVRPNLCSAYPHLPASALDSWCDNKKNSYVPLRSSVFNLLLPVASTGLAGKRFG